jgi:hypothetical protein
MSALIPALPVRPFALICCLLALPALAQQSSLDLDGTTFVPPSCAERTEWSLDIVTDGVTLDAPAGEEVAVHFVVTEGGTRSLIRGSGELVINNYGEVHAALSSVAVTLERPVSDNQFPLAPASANWELLGAALQNESEDCGAVARTCEGEIADSPGSSLVLFDADNNDVIALTDLLPIPDTEPEDVPPLVLGFSFEIDISDLGLMEGDQLRTGVYVTFSGAGSRGGDTSCSLDANCNGVIDIDDPASENVNESEEDNYRTVWERDGFQLPACEATCASVELAASLLSSDEACLGVEASDLLETIPATGVEGAASLFELTGIVSCLFGECEAAVAAAATLTCAEDQSAVTGSPATATISASCGSGPVMPGIQPGDFCSQTQGGWGTACAGANPGCLRDENFAAVFPNGLVVGDQGGPDQDDVYSILLTSAAAVEAFLPAGGTPAALTADLTDPLMSAGGIFAGQAVAATMSVGFDAAGLRLVGQAAHQPGALGLLVYGDCVADGLLGMSVKDVLGLANVGLSGGDVSGAGVTLSDLSSALAMLNQEFVDCETANGCLSLPGTVSAVTADSDGGGESDGSELDHGRDPLDPTDDIDLEGAPAGDLAPPDAPDGQVDIGDVLRLLRLAVELEELSDEALLRGDIAPALVRDMQGGSVPMAWPIGDGRLNVGDVWLLLRAAIGSVETVGN